MNLSLHLRIVGALMICLATFHFGFPKRVGWKRDLAQLQLLTRQIFVVHFGFIVYVLYFFGAMILIFPNEILLDRPLNRFLLGGLGVFWLIRLFAQLFVYDRSLWLGNRFNTGVH